MIRVEIENEFKDVVEINEVKKVYKILAKKLNIKSMEEIKGKYGSKILKRKIK